MKRKEKTCPIDSLKKINISDSTSGPNDNGQIHRVEQTCIYYNFILKQFNVNLKVDKKKCT